MLAAGDLIRLFRRALDEHWGYIWDGRGQVWTQAMQDKSTREMTMLYGEVEIYPGTAVFQAKEGRRTHIGLYVGDGKCIEAHGTRSGVIESDLSDWDEWGTLSAVDYSGVEPDRVTLDSLKALRKGDSGLTVKWLQELLMAAGCDLGKADGVFGSKTKAAVEDFQRKHGLTVDGIAGKKTIAALTALEGEPVEVPEDDEPEEELTMAQKVETMWEWWLTVAGGGDSDGS